MASAMRTILGKHANRFCVLYSDTLYDEPVRLTHYWPIGNQDACEDSDIGAECFDAGPGAYSFKPPGTAPFCGFWRTVRLANGEQTQPIHTAREPIPAPRTRVETEYRVGQWWKRLARRGWVAA